MNYDSTPRNIYTPRKGYTGSYDGRPYSFNGEVPSAMATAAPPAFLRALEALRFSAFFSLLAAAFSSSAF